MDVQRNIVIVALAIVSYMMILAWNEDYGTPAATPVPAPSTLAKQEGIKSPPKISPNAGEFDTPEQLSGQKVAAKTSPAVQVGNHITVKTDVLDLTISLNGGNIMDALLPKYTVAINSDVPMPLLETSSKRTFYVESGLYGKNGFDSSRNGPRPTYTSSQKEYQLKNGQKELVVDLHFDNGKGIDVIKRYQFTRDSYQIKINYIVKNNSSKPWVTNFAAKIVRDQSPDPSSSSKMGMHSFLGMVLSRQDKNYEKFSFSNMEKESVNFQSPGGWIAFIQHYFLTAWIPSGNVIHTYQSKIKNGLFLMGFINPAVTIEPGAEKTFDAKLYVGPKIIKRLKEVAPHLDLTVDYGWLFFIAYPIFLLLSFLHGIVQNWGISIILVTVIVKALFFKLSATSYRSMANMRKLAPKLASLKEQYGDDKKKMSQAMMELYKKEKINPLGGCLPILVQMPVFISLYWVIMESVQLRHAPFFFWIHDLSVMDPYFILPILMGISMYIQTSLNPTPPDPMQAKVMKIMPVMFSVFFLWFPAGLVLYWVVNNILSITQQWIITKRIEQAG